MNHQGVFWNVHYFATVVLRKQLNSKSAVMRSKRSSCYRATMGRARFMVYPWFIFFEPRSHGPSAVHGCTIAVLSYVADMSSDVMGYTEPIISCVLSDNKQHKTGN